MKLLSNYLIACTMFFIPFNCRSEIQTAFETDFNAMDQESKNISLIDAIESQNLEAVKLLVTYGADVNALITRSDSVKICPLLLAIRNPEILEFLISMGADVNVKLVKRNTLLHIAAQNADAYQTLCILLNNGADVNAADLYGRVPLHQCLHIRQNALVLIEYGANIMAPDHEGWKPIHRGFQRCDIDLLKKFVELGASLDEFTPAGGNALHLACHINNQMNSQIKKQKMELLKFLIEEQGMDVNKNSNWPNGTTGFSTPFMLAIASSYFDDEDFAELEYLIMHGAKINTQIFYILHHGNKHVLHDSVLSWAIASKLPYHVIDWLRKKQSSTKGK